MENMTGTSGSIFTWESGERPISTVRMLWIFYFCYATFAALIFQKLLLPMAPSIHGGHGLLVNDGQYFHDVAASLAEKISRDGWVNWTIWPTQASGGNVAILAALYVCFGPDPSLLIPVNAVLHATGGVLIFMLGRSLWPGSVGAYGGLVASVLFIIFPSSLNWYGQIHKDGYAIVGTLLVLFSWVRWQSNGNGLPGLFWLALGNLAGVMLIAFVRPYGVQILVPVLILSFVIMLAATAALGKRMSLWRMFSGASVILLVLLVAVIVQRQSSLTDLVKMHHGSISEKQEQMHVVCPHQGSWSWRIGGWLPERLDDYARGASTIRASFVCSGYDAGSTIDRDQAPESLGEMLAYLPRALQVSMWAPFPSSWFQNVSLARMVGWMETIVWYLMAPGVVILLLHRRSAPLFFTLSFVVGFLCIYGYVIPNVGTLHRIRYPYISILILLGAMGWLALWSGRRAHQPASTKCCQDDLAGGEYQGHDAATQGSKRRQVTQAGLLVSALTAGTYLLLFARDVLMSRWYGLGVELDAFFMAMLLPMFLVNVFSIPMGAALIPVYQSTYIRFGEVDARLLISGLSFYAGVTVGAIALLILVLGPWLLPLIGWGFNDAQLSQSLDILPYGAAILFFSVFVILANSVLNAHQRFLPPALSQLAVPLFAIGSLILLGVQMGVVAVAVGMLIGQLINLLLLQYYLKHDGVSLRPRVSLVGTEWREVFSLLIALAVAALFTNAVMVVDSSMASTLGEGSVGAYSLGSKVVLFITGVIGTGITTVILPHFASYLSRNRVIEGRQELSFYLFVGTIVMIPLGLLLFVFAENLIQLVFGGGLGEADVKTVSRVMAFGVIQLPFFTGYILLIKFANAARERGVILIAAIIGLALNVILNLFFMRFLGVSGLALATSIAMFMTVLVIMLLTYRKGDMSVIDVLWLTLLWLLYLTIVICLHYASYAGVVVGVLAILLLFYEHLGGFWMSKPKELVSALGAP